MRRVLILIVIAILLSTFSLSFGREVSFTQEDRERLIRLETRLEEGLKAINQRIDDTNKRIDDTNKRIEDTNKRIDDLQTFMLWGFGILFGGMWILIGFVIWDRRTALAPVARKNKELEEREEKIERALKELAKKDPKVEEVLRHVGLL